MSIYSLSAPALLRSAEHLIDGSAGSSEIMERMAPYGYDSERLEEGRALLDAFRREIREQRAAQGEQEALTAQLEAARRDVHRRIYMPVYLVAEHVHEDDPDARERLRLDEHRAEAFDYWVEQARAFFDTLLSDEALYADMHGFTEERLQEARADVEAIAALDAEQESAKASRVRESKERAEARAALVDWMGAYREMARYGLRDTPELQQQIGL